MSSFSCTAVFEASVSITCLLGPRLKETALFKCHVTKCRPLWKNNYLDISFFFFFARKILDAFFGVCTTVNAQYKVDLITSDKVLGIRKCFALALHGTLLTRTDTFTSRSSSTTSFSARAANPVISTHNVFVNNLRRRLLLHLLSPPFTLPLYLLASIASSTVPLPRK